MINFIPVILSQKKDIVLHQKKCFFNPSFPFLLSFSIAAKLHDLTAKESALTNASLQDSLTTSVGRFVIKNKDS